MGVGNSMDHIGVLQRKGPSYSAAIGDISWKVKEGHLYPRHHPPLHNFSPRESKQTPSSHYLPPCPSTPDRTAELWGEPEDCHYRKRSQLRAVCCLDLTLSPCCLGTGLQGLGPSCSCFISLCHSGSSYPVDSFMHLVNMPVALGAPASLSRPGRAHVSLTSAVLIPLAYGPGP